MKWTSYHASYPVNKYEQNKRNCRHNHITTFYSVANNLRKITKVPSTKNDWWKSIIVSEVEHGVKELSLIWKIPELSCCCTNTLLSLFSANFVQSTLIVYQIDPLVNTPSIWGTHWFYVCLVFWHQIVKKGPGGAQRKPSKMRKSGLT